jgi:hypothetical protein
MCELLALMPGMAQKYKMGLCLANGMTVEHYVDDLDSIYWVVEDNEPDISDYSEPVTTGNATDVGVYAAKVSAWANNLNGKDDATTVVGVIYCMDGTPTQNNGKRATVGIAEIGDDGKYDVALADLAPATTYYYRAFMNVGGTYVYGKVCSFVTEGQGIGFTTGVACIKTNRNFIGCELVKEYYDNLGKPRLIKHLTNEYKIIEDKLLGKNETE